MSERAEADPRVGDSILVRAAAAEVMVAGAPLPLTGRERELTVAIAMQARPVSAAALGHLLYPDRDDDVNTVIKVYVYRLRRNVTADFIVCRDGGYALGPKVQLDVAQARRYLDELPNAQALEDDEREAILVIARGLRSEPPDALLCREWFEPFPRRFQRLGHDLAISVGRNALKYGRLREAVRVGQELTYEDPCDEEAWDLLIRAQLDVGEPVAAARGFRFYETVLAKELETVPSPSIRSLFQSYGMTM